MPWAWNNKMEPIGWMAAPRGFGQLFKRRDAMNAEFHVGSLAGFLCVHRVSALKLAGQMFLSRLICKEAGKRGKSSSLLSIFCICTRNLAKIK
jgi:hypothetical protein